MFNKVLPDSNNSEYSKVGWKLPAYHLSITNIWSFFSLQNVHYAEKEGAKMVQDVKEKPPEPSQFD
ncbi:hypothetical protein [Prevotella corporis]|uniref:Uncharacterized protein n=1 Tax=Prevotella corporis TaxID=28128 RepID=A0A133PZ94_9BACT|nr:hypothetical protein [Prevotella corporis]KXA35696.1 hypothetical protein HMPREF3226_02004 [Prevotella corporis]MDQ7736921.1 hypothetical protein [Prevotella corporis]